MYFSVTKDGLPLRMRRYVFSESFAAISYATYAKATQDVKLAEEALKAFAIYLKYSFEVGVMTPKFEKSRASKAIGPHMIAIITAQELRDILGDVNVSGNSLSEWIDISIAEIEKDFLKHDLRVLMESVALDGSIIDHFDGRTLNPGHAIECAWFFMHEGRLKEDERLIKVGTQILDYMWERGWDK